MARARFVLRYRGEGSPPAPDVDRVRSLAGVVVVDISPRMLLVDSDDGPLRELVDELSGWIMSAEQSFAVPDTREKIERPPT